MVRDSRYDRAICFWRLTNIRPTTNWQPNLGAYKAPSQEYTTSCERFYKKSKYPTPHTCPYCQRPVENISYMFF